MKLALWRLVPIKKIHHCNEMESINLLTRSQICGDMCIAADNPQESTCSAGTTCDELDGDGAGAGEGAGDVGAGDSLPP